MKILNFGSINIDHVYRVPHLVCPGETISCSNYKQFAGGKGANQSVALGRAGADVVHAGKIGHEAEWMLKKLKQSAVNVDAVEISDELTGHAVIQVSEDGENSIVLFPGTNYSIDKKYIDNVFMQNKNCDYLLIQNEINEIPYIMEKAKQADMKICFNPAPFYSNVLDYPLGLIDILIVNETEAEGISRAKDEAEIINKVRKQYPDTDFIMTRGAEGVSACFSEKLLRIPAKKVETVVDTTAAGDTFIGYYLASVSNGIEKKAAVEAACDAAAVCVSAEGAMDSIPYAGDCNCIKNSRGRR